MECTTCKRLGLGLESGFIVAHTQVNYVAIIVLRSLSVFIWRWKSIRKDDWTRQTRPWSQEKSLNSENVKGSGNYKETIIKLHTRNETTIHPTTVSHPLFTHLHSCNSQHQKYITNAVLLNVSSGRSYVLDV